MDFSNFAQTIGQQMAQQVVHDIYHEIVINTVIYAAKVGILAGLVMAVVAMALGALKFSALDLTTYTGCMITSKPKGAAPFIAGFIFHVLMSAVFGVVYLYLIHTFALPLTTTYAIGLGVIHTLFSGSFMLVLDAINPCVAKKLVPRVGFAGSAQGLRAVATYALIHIVFAVTVVTMLAR